mgnify:CR=1 FL=1
MTRTRLRIVRSRGFLGQRQKRVQRQLSTGAFITTGDGLPKLDIPSTTKSRRRAYLKATFDRRGLARAWEELGGRKRR